MEKISVTAFRKHVPDYLGRVQKGEDIALTSRGKVIARIVPATDERKAAREQLAALRNTAIHIGDVVSPLEAEWEASRADT